jgi:glycosyltransferase involved in cell wall biosynthesis
MASGLPVVCLFGVEQVHLESPGPVPPFETAKLDCRCYQSDADLDAILARDRPHAIVTFGNAHDYPRLMQAPFDVRKRWIHYPHANDLAEVGRGAFHCFLHNALQDRRDVPLVTVFTPAYRTGPRIERPFRSLRSQTYRDWEWVLLDDSDDSGETFRRLSDLAAGDYRVRVYRGRHSGIIGRVKKDACLLGRGEFLVELDHDDALTPDALETVVAAFRKYPEAGFVYSDFAECFEDNRPFEYSGSWAFGYGNYREETHQGVRYQVAGAPNLNAKTIRHIVGVPNHVRAWRRSTYLEIGGHADWLHVADDYELLLRTFLHTRMARIPRLCYIQYRNAEGNTHRARNQEIQRLVRYLSQWYDRRIHDRLVELGVEDFVWKEGEDSFSRLEPMPNPQPEPHCTILAEV